MQAPLTSSKSHDSADLGRPVALQPSPTLGSTPATRQLSPHWTAQPSFQLGTQAQEAQTAPSPLCTPIIYPYLRLCSCPKFGHRVVIFLTPETWLIPSPSLFSSPHSTGAARTPPAHGVGAPKPGLSLCSTPPPQSGRGELLSLVVAEIQELKDKEALTQEGAPQ